MLRRDLDVGLRSLALGISGGPGTRQTQECRVAMYILNRATHATWTATQLREHSGPANPASTLCIDMTGPLSAHSDQGCRLARIPGARTPGDPRRRAGRPKPNQVGKWCQSSTACSDSALCSSRTRSCTHEPSAERPCVSRPIVTIDPSERSTAVCASPAASAMGRTCHQQPTPRLSARRSAQRVEARGYFLRCLAVARSS